YLVLRRVEHGMQGHGQFHNPQRRPQMPAGGGDGINRLGPQFIGNLLELLNREVPHVRRIRYTVQRRKTAQRRNGRTASGEGGGRMRCHGRKRRFLVRRTVHAIVSIFLLAASRMPS
ncbi:hypothetical protein ATR1_018c0046, partial [Acetobacter tropicalis]